MARGGSGSGEESTTELASTLLSAPAGQVLVAAVGLGVVGYAAKGVALLVVGGLFALAAWQQDPEEAGGLDSALRSLAAGPLGTSLLLVVALGLMLYGVYSFARARFARL